MTRKITHEQLRNEVYPICLNLMNKGMEIEAYIIMLSTWNFASFRYAMKTFDLRRLKKTLIEIEPLYKKLEHLNFKTVEFDKYQEEIKKIYSELHKFQGIKITGAPKLMHLKIPELFVMWDDRIKKHYGFRKGNPEEYFDFLKLMQKKYRNYEPRKGITLARTIDLINMEKITEKTFFN